ncbi:MAG: hypothetical protein ACAI43_05655 [Phycisphaerae bacterium]|nr:hypothetical protein [Tepidisphaeraceae bacterium]
MKRNRIRTWLYSAVLAAGVAAPTFSVLAAERDSEAQVKYANTPREVQEALDRERRNHDIKRIDRVVRDGRVFYRAVIDEKGADLVVRVSDGGRVLSREDARDVPVGREADDRTNNNFGGTENQIRYAAAPRNIQEALDRERGRHDLKAIYEVRTPGGRTFYRGVIDERGTDRVVRISEDGRVLGDSDLRAREVEARPAAARLSRTDYGEGQEVNYDRLPGAVRSGIAREAKANTVQRVYEYRGRGGGSVFKALVGNGDRTFAIRVDENGRFLSTANATEEGKIRVSFRDLPGDVKATIAREIPERDLRSIIQVTRDGRTYYRAEADEGAISRWVTVDDRGRVTGEIDRPDYDRR